MGVDRDPPSKLGTSLSHLADIISSKCPDTGFALLVFEFGDQGTVNYISNANPRDVAGAISAHSRSPGAGRLRSPDPEKLKASPRARRRCRAESSLSDLGCQPLITASSRAPTVGSSSLCHEPAACGLRGFVVLPRRWMVERTLVWLNRNRRLAKDFEASIESATTWLYIASVKLMSRRLGRA
jgi:transposase